MLEAPQCNPLRNIARLSLIVSIFLPLRRHINILPEASMVRKASSASNIQYESAYRPRKNIEEPVELQYENFRFFRTEYEVEENGTVYPVQKDVVETIEIARGWQKHRKGGKPMEGYISKGLSKFVFQVKFI